MSKKFKRTDISRYSKLGRGRKKLTKWRKPKGRDNKIREHRFGYPVSPTVGHRSRKNEAGKIKGLQPLIVENLKDFEKADKKTIIILSGKVGAKKKLDLIKKAEEMKLKILNIKSGGKKWSLKIKKCLHQEP